MAGSLTGAGTLGSFLPGSQKMAANVEQQDAMAQETLTLFLSGDVMTGRGIDQVLPYSVEPTLHERYVNDARRYVQLAEEKSGPIPGEVSYPYVWGDALQILNEADPSIRIINLETSVTTSDEWTRMKGIHYRMHPKNVDLLKTGGIDLCVLANNHVMDYGVSGLKETFETLHTEGITTSGAGVNEASALSPAKIETGSGNLLVFSYGLRDSGVPPAWNATNNQPGVNYLPDLSDRSLKKVLSEVRGHKYEDDRVIISLHWGGNWGYEIPDAQRNFAHQLIDQGGVDLIHGHSSHHPKGIEVYNDRLILYGCGDLINDYEGIGGKEQYRSELSLMYFPELDATGELAGLKMAPMHIKQFQLHQAGREESQWLAERLKRESEKLGCSVRLTEELFLALRF